MKIIKDQQENLFVIDSIILPNFLAEMLIASIDDVLDIEDPNDMYSEASKVVFRCREMAIDEGCITDSEEINDVILKTIVLIVADDDFGRAIITECQSKDFIERYNKMLEIMDSVGSN